MNLHFIIWGRSQITEAHVGGGGGMGGERSSRIDLPYSLLTLAYCEEEGWQKSYFGQHFPMLFIINEKKRVHGLLKIRWHRY